MSPVNVLKQELKALRVRIDGLVDILDILRRDEKHIERRILALDSNCLIAKIRGMKLTNHYLCPTDQTRWDADNATVISAKCPTCSHRVRPYASTNNIDEVEKVHDQATYNKANVVA